MSTPLKKIPVELTDGKRHTLFYDTEALVSLEEALGGTSFLDYQGIFGFSITPEQALQTDDNDFVNQIRISRIRAVLWAGLLHELPRLTLKQTSGFLNMKNLIPVTVACMSAYSSALSLLSEDDVAEEADGKNPQGPDQTAKP